MVEGAAPAASPLLVSPDTLGAASGAPVVESRLFRGLPCLHLRWPGGDAATVALRGAQVLSWVCGGRERLYLSPKALFDGESAIRGGVPVCFPQFNQRGSLPKHGFARNLTWTALPAADGVPDGINDAAAEVPRGSIQAAFRLCDSEATRALWPQAFEALLTVQLAPGSLQITLQVRNTDALPLRFTGALHTYLAVDDIAAARLDGLSGQAGWDALTNQTAPAAAEIRFDGEFDRVHAAAPSPLTLHDGPHRLRIAQSASLADTVVWNPGAALCRRLPDMPADGFTRMLCVEAAQVMAPVEVPAGGAWRGWQRLTVL